jgi:uncharacterized protein (UPF0262 family)
MYFHSDEYWKTHIEPCLIKLKATYLLKIDADEFLYLNNFKNIQEMITFYEPFDSILINWLIFGGSYLEKNDKNTITNIFTKSNDVLHFHVKSLAKVSSIINFNNNAHTFRLKEKSIVKDIDNNIVNFKQDNKKNMENITTHKLSVMSFKNRIYLAHYICQDYYTFIQRKFLDNISDIYFSYNFFKNTCINDKLLFKENFTNNIELSLDYVKKLHLSKAINQLNIFNTPIKMSLKIMLDAIVEYYYFVDNGGNKIDNYDIKNSVEFNKALFSFSILNPSSSSLSNLICQPLLCQSPLLCHSPLL